MRAFALLLIVSTVAVLAGCAGGTGFRPLYGNLGAGEGVREKIARIEIETIPGRNGQRIRNELIFQTTGGGTAPPPAYLLEIATKEQSEDTLIASNGVAAGSTYIIEAKFKLTRRADRKALLEGISLARSSYDRSQQAFANVRASDAAGALCAKTIANDIHGRLAAFLSQPDL